MGIKNKNRGKKVTKGTYSQIYTFLYIDIRMFTEVPCDSEEWNNDC